LSTHSSFANITNLGAGGTCCLRTSILSPTPSHTPFPSTGTTNSEDPQGWLYTLIGANFGFPFEQLGPREVSSLWTPQLLEILYTGCPYTTCTGKYAGVAPASAVASQAYILATSTITISSSTPTSTPPAAEGKPSQTYTSITPTVQSSVVVDPVYQTPTVPGSTESSLPSPKSNTQNSAASIHSSTSVPPETIPTQSPTETQHITTMKSLPPSGTASSNPSVLDVASTAASQGSKPGSTASNQASASSVPITIGSGSTKTVLDVQTSDPVTIVVDGSSNSTLSLEEPSTRTVSITVVSTWIWSPSTGIVVSGTTITDLGGYIWSGLGGTSSVPSTSVLSMTGNQSSLPTTEGSSAPTSNTSSNTVLQQTTSGALKARQSVSRHILLLFGTVTLMVGLFDISST
jgi:hypothetical protein